ncbi:MAG: restriction endonuclease [Opitutaceae bacterium]|nr:restriction endonuclease [Opitutaceae bacterium]
MAKKSGDAYQDAVAFVARNLEPSAEIRVGTWIDGPDGRRDLDVVLQKKTPGAPKVVIECKDWNRPIGIGFIDALESKRRDIGASVAMICSNSGFSSDALRKAARVGIPTLAALIEGDRRIRVVVREQIFTRIVDFVHHGCSIHHQAHSAGANDLLQNHYTKEWLYCGKSLESWVAGKLMRIGVHASRSHSILLKHIFKALVPFDIRGTSILVSGVDIKAKFNVQWMTQVAEIGASSGMYDYMRKVVLFGPGCFQFHLKNIDTKTWGEPIAIEEVPPHLLQHPIPTFGASTPQVAMSLSMLRNMPQSDPKDAPDLDPLVLSQTILNDGV